MQIPAFLEVEPDAFKATRDCAYAEILAARNREGDFQRRAMLDKLIRACRPRWSVEPTQRVRDILGP
jgi:hypothetical protein